MLGEPREKTKTEAEETEATAKLLRGVAAGILVVLGLGLLGFGGVVWLDTGAPGPSTVHKTSTTQVTTPGQLAKNGGTTTTSLQSTDTSTPGSASLRSEAVAATLFGLGALLVLTGLFFNRVTQVTFPGGGALTIGPDTQATLVAKAAETAEKQGLPRDPATLAALYQAAFEELAKRRPAAYYTSYRRSGWPGGSDWVGPGGASGWGTGGTSPGDDEIEQAVVAAARRVAPREDA